MYICQKSGDQEIYITENWFKKKNYSGNAEYVFSLNMLDIDTNNILSYTNRIFRIFCMKKKENIFKLERHIHK